MAIDISKYTNDGVFIEEKDFSLYTIPAIQNVSSLVLGCSRKGPFNIPIEVNSPENFEEIYGKEDRNLERKGSFFHKTVKNLLGAGPVTCINLLLTDEDKDRYNWKSFSTTSITHNAPTRTNAVDNFFDKRGFWKRSPEQLLNVAENNKVDSQARLFHVVNMGDKPVTLLLKHLPNSGFNVTLEDWYGGREQVPNFLHPKDFVSDYMMEAFVIEGRWSDYRLLATHPVWGKYFSTKGLRKGKIQDFLNEPNVNFLKRFEGSLIPYFNDARGKDMWLPSLINNEIDELGLLVVQDVDKFEMSQQDDYNVDLLGAGLEERILDGFDFLSYKERIIDLLVLDEIMVDHVGNGFGIDLSDHLASTSGTAYYAGRRVDYVEGYVNGCRIKPLILSSTGSVTVKPFDCDGDSYVVFKGNKFDFNNEMEFVFALHEHVTQNTQALMVFYVDETGIKMKIGDKSAVQGTVRFPYMDPENTLVLAYYKFYQIGLQYYIDLPVGVTISIDEFIPPFRLGNESKPKIHLEEVTEDWQIKIYFENVKQVTGYDYHLNRIHYLWKVLSTRLIEKVSMILDTNGKKKVIDWIEPGSDDTGKWFRIGILDKKANIKDTVSVNRELAIYFKDIDFIFQDEVKMRTTENPFIIGQDGIVGKDSMLYEAFKQSFINTGDHFFLEIATEEEVEFINTADGLNLIVLKTGPVEDYVDNKIFVYGSKFNDGVFDVLGDTYYGDYFAIVVEREVVPEQVEELGMFDANILKYLNLYMVNDILYAEYKIDEDQAETYRNITDPDNPNKFRKTIEVEKILNNNQILVDADRYLSQLSIGEFLQAETNDDPYYIDQGFRRRDWVRIIDIVRYEFNNDWLLIETDGAIQINDLNGDLQTEGFVKIENYVNAYNLHSLDGFKVRNESLPDGTEERLDAILNMVAKGTRLHEAISDPEILNWRYLVDSFGLGLTSNCKQQLVDLCGSKGLALGFINMPSAKQFKKSTSPTFINKYGSLSIERIVNGGSRLNSGNFRFGLAEGLGKSNVAYFFPYVIVSDDGRPAFVPPASFAARLFLNKHITRDNQIKPWTIMAGADRGFITGIAGTEMEFTPDELNLLNLFRINVIQTHLTRFYAISSNNTSEISNSALGNIHVREALISLESSLREMLKAFQWGFNIPSVRQEIVRQADEICFKYFKNGAIANYTNIMDQRNNPNAAVEAQIGYLDTLIEPIQGMGTIVLNLGVMRTGGIQRLEGNI